MILTIQENRNSEYIKFNQVYDFDHNDLIELLSNPQEVNSKHDARYIMPFNHVINGTFVKRDSLNASHYTTLILDIDESERYDRVKQLLEVNNMQYYMYTSFSHSILKHKFRVILPLKKMVEMKDFNHEVFRKSIQKVFPFNDYNSLKYTGFYGPCKTDVYRFDYYSNCDAVPFDMECKPFLEILNKEYTIWKKEQNELKKKKEYYEKKMKTSNKEKSTDVNDYPYKKSIVDDYLNTPYPYKSGNKTSNTSFYNAIVKCLSVDDQISLQRVIYKAKSEHWTDTQINQKIRCAKSYLIKKGII